MAESSTRRAPQKNGGSFAALDQASITTLNAFSPTRAQVS
jgi:hypothetical protein